jgi:hypothetical protein
MTPLQIRQRYGSFLLGSRVPHDSAAVHCLFLARRLSGCSIR